MQAGQLIKVWRERRGLSQREAAPLLGITPPTLSRWEAEKMEPDGPHLRRVAEVTRIPIAKLIAE